MVRVPGIKLGFIPANRKTFPQDLAAKMRRQTIEVMQSHSIEVIVPDEKLTSIGCIQNREEAEHCARLFAENEVHGIIIGAANFGDEQSASWTVRQSGLDVPILLFACPEERTLSLDAPRRDSFCGLLSIGEALRQIGAAYSVAQRPIAFPTDESFTADLDWFVRVCRVVSGIRNARYGQVGARPDAFWTCRYDEKQLQRLGPTTVVIDLSEVISEAERIPGRDRDLKRVMREIQEYADTSQITQGTLERSARLELFLRRWVGENDLDALAIQCWTSMQVNYGVCACLTMSRLADEGIPCACEADILGTLSLHACQLASGAPAALADWNNLHNDDDELVNLWHCGVFPKSFADVPPKVSHHRILAASGIAPPEAAEGVIEFKAAVSPVTLCRVTQGEEGGWKAVIAHGEFEDDTAETFGSYGWCRIPHLQRLYREVLLRHFPHHVAITQGYSGNALWEAFGNYFRFSMYHPTQDTPGLFTPRLPF